MEINYIDKYLKYKLKYHKLKNQIGGVLIHHFHHQNSSIAMAEAITYNTLKDNITQHCMGTGIYGFINHNTEAASIYNRKPNVHTVFSLRNPIILQNTWEQEGEPYNDSSNFTWLSMQLNMLCTKIFNDNIPITPENVVTILNSNHLYQNENLTYDGIPNTIISVDDIVNIVRVFIQDYSRLMQTNKHNENYVLLPINYLAYLKNFDGVLNRINDIPSIGSIKYIFDSSYGARGYITDYKRPELLRGQLIFSRELLDALKI
jgi:hypothetical protein